jgi:hypothetical protein
VSAILARDSSSVVQANGNIPAQLLRVSSDIGIEGSKLPFALVDRAAL